MSGASISYRNLVDAAQLSVAAGGGSPHEKFPLSNLQRRELSSVARIEHAVSFGIGTFRLIIDRGAGATPITGSGLAALMGVNASAIDTATLAVTTSADSSTYSSLGNLIASGDAGVPQLPQQLICPWSGTVQRYVRMVATWIVPAGVDYVEAGRAWFGTGIAIPEGIDADWELGFIEAGELDASAGRQYYENKQDRTRSLRVSLTGVSREVAFGFGAGDVAAADVPSLQGLQFEAGATGDIVVIPSTSSAIWMRRLGIYGHIDSNERPTIRKLAGDYYATSFLVIEER